MGATDREDEVNSSAASTKGGSKALNRLQVREGQTLQELDE